MASLTEALAIAHWHMQQGRWNAAVEICQQILAQHADQAAALELLSQIRTNYAQLEQAIAQWQLQLGKGKDAQVLNQMGLIRRQQEQWDQAIGFYQQAIHLHPQFAEAHCNLANLLRSRGRVEEAIIHYQAAIDADPTAVEARNNLANVLKQLGRLPEAVAQYRAAIEQQPSFADAHNNLGVVLHEQGEFAAAIGCYHQALQLNPAYPDAHVNLGLLKLLLGDLATGFREYEWRWQRRDIAPRSFAQPRWDGSDLQGKTILIHVEQGFGDTIQFLRYVPLLGQRGGRVLVECAPPMQRLLAAVPEIQQLVLKDAPLPAFDCYTSLLSLPHQFGTTQETVPPPLALTAPPLQAALPVTPQLKVGLVWAGSSINPIDARRSIDLSQLQPLLSLPQIRIYSLQTGERATDLTPFLSAQVYDLSPSLQDFADTAAVVAALDLVITVDTAIAHLAGSLGKPVWVLLPFVPDWRWLLDRSDSPWYPTARLFRQTQAGDWAGVVERVRQALIEFGQQSPITVAPVTPDVPPAHQTLALAQQRFQAGEYEATLHLCQQVLRQQPQNLHALEILGLVHCQMGAYEQVIAPYQQLLTLKPDLPNVHHNLGMALAELGRVEQAIAHYQQAIALNPATQPAHPHAAAWVALAAKTYYNLGNAHRTQSRWQEAIEAYHQALSLQPDYAEAHHNLGFTLQLQGQLPAAIGAYQHALSLKPHYPDACNSLGSALKSLGQLEEAVAYFQQAIALKPSYPEAYNNLGLARYEQGQFRAAADCYQQALHLRPDYPEAHFNFSLLLLQLGYLRQGFQEYEWRWQRRDLAPRSFEQPIWAGGDLTNKTILIHAEQGLGDTLQFIRYAPLVQQRGGQVVVECQESLVPLLRSVQGIDRLIVKAEPLPTFDYHASLLSLPHLLGTTLEDVPAAVPYLVGDRHHPLFSSPPSTGLRVGFVWAGNPSNPNDHNRSAPLAALADLFTCPGVHFYSLQKEIKAEEVEQFVQWQQAGLLTDWGTHLEDFADTAAAIASLDLILTVDTAVAHLAGALAKPVWVMLCQVPDWRWLWKRDDSPWYPTARLFRQTTRGDWSGVCQQVIEALTHYQPEPVEPSAGIDQMRHWLRQDELTQAARVGWQVLSQNPQQAIALMLLGQIADRRQQWSTALSYFHRAISVQPTLAEAHNRLGNVLQRQRRFAEAIPYYQQAIAHQPNYVEAHSNLGAAYEEIDCYADSIACYQAALQLRPDYADAYYNLGNTYRSQGDFAAAVTAYRQAIALQPHYPMAHNNLGLALYDLAQPAAAIVEYDRAIALVPDNPDAHLNRGLARLIQGNLRQGFEDYEWRWRVVGGDFKPLPAFSQPRWRGEDLQGKTILLWAEQGLGDTLQFIRYANLVRDRGGRVIVECQPSLQRLLSTLPAIAQVIAQGDPRPAFDTYSPLLSLPQVLGTRLDTVPAVVPYLHAPIVKPLTAPNGDLKVGIVWAGNPNHRGDRYRSCPFHHLLPLLQTPGVTFYSLQVGRSADLTAHPSLTIHDLGAEFDDLADTAAAIAALDLVITVDTAVAHLTGALGKPVWIMLSYAPDWRWLLDRSDSPWYPSARLFRQSHAGDWGGVVADVIVALKALIPTTAPPAPLAPKLIGIGFPIGVNTGWRVYGLNLALQLLRIPGVAPAPLTPLSSPHLLNPIHRAMLTPTLVHQRALHQLLDRHRDQTVTGDLLVIKPLGNNLVTPEDMRRIFGQPTLAAIFFEDTHLTPAAIAQASQYELILAGSSWNTEVLRHNGIAHVATVLQGIDPGIFHPAPAVRWFGDRFVIFSGGKLEYRKGQDLVIAAFKAFHQRHPDALLLTAWHNPWLDTMAGLEQTGYLTGLPKVNQGQIAIKPWLVANGLPPEAVIDLGAIPNHLAGQILREADVAVFPNRAEGGTNLVAMESLACGIPTILSTNTGHQDLLGDHCYPLSSQGLVRGCPLYRGTDGWGESAVEEIVATLETIYTDRTTAQQRGTAAHQFMQDWTWDKQVKRLLTAIAPFL